jgi:antitoxin VapB
MIRQEANDQSYVRRWRVGLTFAPHLRILFICTYVFVPTYSFEMEYIMLNTAKVFTNGNSQAVRLPKAYRVNVEEMWISKNELTGEITLKPKDDDERLRKLNLLFKMIEETPLTDDFLPPRDDAWAPDPFADGVNKR